MQALVVLEGGDLVGGSREGAEMPGAMWAREKEGLRRAARLLDVC